MPRLGQSSRTYGLLALFGVIAAAAIPLAYVANLLHRPREVPCVHVMKTYAPNNPGTGGSSITFIVKSEKDGIEEFYSDYAPWGTVNVAGTRTRLPWEHFHEELLGTAKEKSVQKVSPEYQARYDALREFVSQQVDIEKKPWGWRRSFLLPEDYPTFGEFHNEFYNQQNSGTP